MEGQDKVQQVRESFQTVKMLWVILACLVLIGIMIIGTLYITRTTIRQYSLEELCVLLEKVYPQYSTETGIPLEKISSRSLGSDGAQSRVTHILLCDESGASCGIMIGSVKFQGSISGSAGDQTVKIEKLEDGSMILEVDSGEWKFSTDGGSTYKVIADTETIASNYLALDNTTSFTPDADYEPATKKYVDDNSGSGNATEFALEGTGTGSLASMTVSPTGWVTSGGQFTFFGVVIADSLTRAESFYKITETEYSANVINFGKTSDNRLTLIIGANTYTSGVVFDSATIGVPVEVGVACDATGGSVTFFFAGSAEAEQAATFTYPTINLNEQHILGDALDGSMFYMSLVARELIAQNTYHTPLREGLAAASNWKIHYNMNAAEGTSVIDRVYEQTSSGTDYTMTVTNGSWVEYVQRY